MTPVLRVRRSAALMHEHEFTKKTAIALKPVSPIGRLTDSRKNSLES